jgi:uridine kinase
VFKQPDLVARVFDRIPVPGDSHGARPFVVAVSGIDCCGKTTLAKALAGEAERRGLSATILGIDDFIRPASIRENRQPAHLGYFEEVFDYARFIAELEQLSAGSGLHLLIAEGVFLFRKELISRWDLKVWLEMEPTLSLERGPVRDAGFFGSVQAGRSAYEETFIPAYRMHLERDRPVQQADMVFEVF